MSLALAQIIPPVVTEVLAAVAAASVSLGVPYIAYKFSALNDFHVVLYGVEGVDSFDGIVGSVELLNEEVEENGEIISEHKRELDSMSDEIESIKELIDDSFERIENVEDKADQNEIEVDRAKETMSGLEQRVDALYRSIKERNE